ncbi:hypothetical protein [Blautia faecicola]|uniref:Uncharacterized protein n=1 Tax=Blautia faecicola TaxID=2509240 RepID=A0A4Q1RG60_9FIRM|nr:hypothetical protein [Blautia faecicola]RXS74621.1 hypothetical protein ETP43_04975 [Blautia faecicola]
MVSGKYVYAGKKRCAKYQKFILIPDNASWYTAIRSEGLIKASYKIVKRLFCLNYILQKYHRPVRNVAMVCVAAVALGSSTYAWFVKNNKVDATTSTISAQSDAAYMTIKNGTSGASSVDTTSVTTTVATKPLYPATFGEEQGVTKGKFMTGYGTDLNDGSLKGNLKLVGTEGSYSDATGADYALQQEQIHLFMYICITKVETQQQKQIHLLIQKICRMINWLQQMLLQFTLQQKCRINN